MSPGTDCINYHKFFIACRLTAWDDPETPEHVWSIGWGVIEGITAGMVWKQKTADERLVADLEAAGEQVSQLIGDAPTTQGQFDAMVAFARSIGIEAFAGSAMLAAHLAGDHDAAALAFAEFGATRFEKIKITRLWRQAEKAMYTGDNDEMMFPFLPRPAEYCG